MSTFYNADTLRSQWGSVRPVYETAAVAVLTTAKKDRASTEHAANWPADSSTVERWRRCRGRTSSWRQWTATDQRRRSPGRPAQRKQPGNRTERQCGTGTATSCRRCRSCRSTACRRHSVSSSYYDEGLRPAVGAVGRAGVQPVGITLCHRHTMTLVARRRRVTFVTR